jgi:hypothetical protein
MKCASSTTMPVKPSVASQPRAVEDVVVDDDDVGERVDVSPSPWMTVARRCGVQRSTSRAQFILTTFGTTASSGYATGDGCREHRLRGLAEARLVGEQERAVPARPPR